MNIYFIVQWFLLHETNKNIVKQIEILYKKESFGNVSLASVANGFFDFLVCVFVSPLSIQSLK